MLLPVETQRNFMNLNQQSHSSVISGLVAIGAILGFGLACASSSSDIKKSSSPSPTTTNSEIINSKPIVDIPKLMRQSPQVFEKTFGKATEISQTNDPGTVPGEIRDYKVPGAGSYSTTDGMMVRFYKGKAVMIMVDLPAPTSNAEAALSQANLNVKGISPTVEAPLAHRWRNQSLSGMKFKDVAAHRLDDSRNFTTVQAEVEQ